MWIASNLGEGKWSICCPLACPFRIPARDIELHLGDDKALRKRFQQLRKARYGSRLAQLDAAEGELRNCQPSLSSGSSALKLPPLPLPISKDLTLQNMLRLT